MLRSTLRSTGRFERESLREGGVVGLAFFPVPFHNILDICQTRLSLSWCVRFVLTIWGVKTSYKHKAIYKETAHLLGISVNVKSLTRLTAISTH